MRPDGSDQQQVLAWGLEVGRISWSPDSSHLAAALGTCSDDECRTDIYTLRADGTEVTDVTPNVLEERDPAWSPDGSKIAFDAPSDGNYGIHTIDPDGSGDIALTSGNQDVWPSWAPDGGRIAFASSRTGRSQLYSMRPDGTDETLLTNSSGPQDQFTSPAYSPDGTQIAFYASLGVSPENSDGIFRMPATGGPPVGVFGTARLDDRARLAADFRPAAQSRAATRGRRAPLLCSCLSVPAYRACSAPNRTHGPPLAFPSCAPPSRTSSHLTVGTADANGAPTRTVASLRLTAIPGDPATTADEADVRLTFDASDIWRDTTPLGGGFVRVKVKLGLRITDRNNYPATGTVGATGDISLSAVTTCNTVGPPDGPATCALDTTLDALVPSSCGSAAARSGSCRRSRFSTGVDDFNPTTEPNDLFLTPGVFVP